MCGCGACEYECNTRFIITRAQLIKDSLINFDPTWPQAEESLLNHVYRKAQNDENEETKAYQPLAIEYNMQKRCFKYAKALWNKTLPSLKVIHYVGGKPWQTKEQRAKADWDENESYKVLEAVWWFVKEKAAKGTTLKEVRELIPRAVE